MKIPIALIALIVVIFLAAIGLAVKQDQARGEMVIDRICGGEWIYHYAKRPNEFYTYNDNFRVSGPEVCQ